MTRVIALGLLALTPAFALGACSEEPERPPPYVEPPPANLITCAELRARGELVGTEFAAGGKRANCAADGLKCVLEQTAKVSARCDAAIGEASCIARIWRLDCLTSTATDAAVADSGASDGP